MGPVAQGGGGEGHQGQGVGRGQVGRGGRGEGYEAGIYQTSQGQTNSRGPCAYREGREKTSRMSSTFRNIMSDVNYGISNVGTVMTSCAGSQHHMRPYVGKLERVKFGAPLDQVCKPDLPGPLLMMLLKLNKEGPFKKEVFRAPGHAQSMRKLVHFLQQGRLVNIQNYSLSTIASVIKKFLRKIPGGIFGPENEATLFDSINITDPVQRMKAVSGLIGTLPSYSQHLLVLLFGTFRIIAANSKAQGTNMTSQALGVSVAPSFFHTCVTSGKTARMEDVERFKDATTATSYIIDNFGMRDLFGRDNYEYYARLTGRILKVEDEWIFFTYPLDCLGIRSDLDLDLRNRSHHEHDPTGSLEMIPENCPLDPAHRLSISLDTEGRILTSPSSPGPETPKRLCQTLGRQPSRTERSSTTASKLLSSTDSSRLKPDNASFSCLPQVHAVQAERMRARSDWFLSDPSGLVTYRLRERLDASPRPTSLGAPPSKAPTRLPAMGAPVGSIGAMEPGSVSGKPPDGQQGAAANVALRRRLSDKDKERRLVRRSSSKRKDKENGGSEKNGGHAGPALKRQSSGDSAGLGHPHPSLSRGASLDSPKGRHSRGSSFDQESGSPLLSPPEPTPRAMPRI